MIGGIRSNITPSNYDAVRRLVNYPASVTFDDALTELIKKFKEFSKKGKKI